MSGFQIRYFTQLVFLVLFAFLSLWASEAQARPSHEEGERPGEMTNALKYLEELDKYYSQVARPSRNFEDYYYPLTLGKRSANDGTRRRRENANGDRFLQIQGLDNHLAHMSRPRFGKRSFGGRVPAEIYVPGYEQFMD